MFADLIPASVAAIQKSFKDNFALPSDIGTVSLIIEETDETVAEANSSVEVRLTGPSINQTTKKMTLRVNILVNALESNKNARTVWILFGACVDALSESIQIDDKCASRSDVNCAFLGILQGTSVLCGEISTTYTIDLE